MKMLGHDFEGGAIVALTRAETDVLTAIQGAVKHRGWRAVDRQLEDENLGALCYLLQGCTSKPFMTSYTEQVTARLKEWLLTAEEPDDE